MRRYLLLALAALWQLCRPTAGAAATPVDVLTEDSARFTSFLQSRVPERRVEGIQGLAQMKHWPAEPLLLRAVNDPSPAVCREAMLAITRVGTERSIPHLISALTNDSWELRDNAALALRRMTAEEFSTAADWEKWWNATPLAAKQARLLATATAQHTNSAPLAQPATAIRRGKRVRVLPASVSPPACADRREALRALRHLAGSSAEPALIQLLTTPQAPPLDPDERIFICEALERVGTTNAIPTLAAQPIDAAAWALGRIGGASAERALLGFPPTLGTLLALDRLHSTNTARLIPLLVGEMAQITYRSHPDDVMNDELQPIQRGGVNLIRRSGLATLFIEAVLQEMERTMQPPLTNGLAASVPAEWRPLFTRMRSELKPGFVREDGATTSQPIVAMSYLADDPTLAKRLVPLLKHPAFVPRVYVALALGRLHAREALPALTNIINEGYAFSDSTALASGKHFDQSQTVRWRGFLCMALGRMGGDPARGALERYATDPKQPRDIRYSSVVGLRFIGSPLSLPALRRVAGEDLIWMVRDEALRTCERIEFLALDSPAPAQHARR